MPKEKNNTIETIQKIILPSNGDVKTDQELIDNFLSHSDDEYRQMGEEIEEAEKKREVEKKKGEIPQELKDYREAWKELIDGISVDSKKQIIQASENIPVRVEKNSDGSRLIEFKLGDKIRKILDPKLRMHSDSEYFNNEKETFITERNEWVKLGGMRGDDVDGRKNRKLKEYIEQKQEEGLYIPTIEEMRDEILKGLGDNAGLKSESDQIAMLMYLTGIDGWYRLSMGNEKSSISREFRSLLRCCNVGDEGRLFRGLKGNNSYASLLMVSCKDNPSEQDEFIEEIKPVENGNFRNIGTIAGMPVEYDESTRNVKFGGEIFDLNPFDGKWDFMKKVRQYADLLNDEDVRKVMFTLNI